MFTFKYGCLSTLSYMKVLYKYLTLVTIKLSLIHSKNEVLNIKQDVEDWLTRIDWRLIVEESVASLLAVSLLSTMQSCDGCNNLYQTEFIADRRPEDIRVAGLRTSQGHDNELPTWRRQSLKMSFILSCEFFLSHFLKCSCRPRHARIIISCAVEFN